MTNYMNLISGNGYARLADDPAFDVTGDVEWRFDIFNANAWPPVDEWLVSRYNSATNSRMFRVRINDFSDGMINIILGTTDGTGTRSPSIDIDLFDTGAPAAGERWQLRIQLDIDNGASQTAATVWVRTGADVQDLESASDWAPVGSGAIAGAHTWGAFAAPLDLGNSEASVDGWEGGAYRFIWWADLTKTAKIADVEFVNANIAPGATDEDEWLDAASANDWAMQGTHETDWDYINTPVNFAAAAGSSSQIDLTWDDALGEASYSIERSADGSTGWTEIATPAAGETTHSDTGLDPSTTWFYRIIAVFGSADSDPSAVASATTDASGGDSGCGCDCMTTNPLLTPCLSRQFA